MDIETPTIVARLDPDRDMNRDPIWQKLMRKDYTGVLADVGNMMQTTRALDYMHYAGLALVSIDRTKEGVDWLCCSLSLTNAPAQWFANAATACMDRKQYAYAILFLKNGIDEHPHDVRLYYMFALCHVHIHEWDKAIGNCQKILTIDPTFYHARLTMGFCYHVIGQYQLALDTYDMILDAAAGDMEEVYNNKACVMMELGQQKEALDYLLEKCPGSERPGTLYNMSFLYMGLGVWPLGWQLYRNRETVNVTHDQISNTPMVEQPIAESLHDIAGRHLLLFHEQGFGDTIQFVRFAQDYAKIASKLTIGVPKQLVRLVQNMIMDKPFDVISDDAAALPCDVAVAMLDSPLLFDMKADAIPRISPYLRIPADMAKKHYIPRTDRKLRVGLVWAGATRLDNVRAHSIDRRRSVSFQEIVPFFVLNQHVEFFSLHLSDHHQNNAHLRRILEDDYDMLDTAAIVDQMDLVISIDSCVAHVAGALGVPTWLLSRYDGCWRWFWDKRTETDWYPSMRIFRQKAHGTWPDVLAEVQVELTKIALKWAAPIKRL